MDYTLSPANIQASFGLAHDVEGRSFIQMVEVFKIGLSMMGTWKGQGSISQGDCISQWRSSLNICFNAETVWWHSWKMTISLCSFVYVMPQQQLFFCSAFSKSHASCCRLVRPNTFFQLKMHRIRSLLQEHLFLDTKESWNYILVWRLRIAINKEGSSRKLLVERELWGLDEI